MSKAYKIMLLVNQIAAKLKIVACWSLPSNWLAASKAKAHRTALAIITAVNYFLNRLTREWD